jgi:hypothetical protein
VKRPAALLVFLCSFDALATIYLVRSGVAEEANPLAAAALAQGPGAFFLWKLSMAVAGAAALALARARRALAATCGAYGLLAAYHVAILAS